MKKLWFSVGAMLALSGCADSDLFSSSSVLLPDGVTLVDTSQEGSGSLTIPYEKYRLDNGLTVILSPDHSDPLVHVDVTYHVGSAREEVGKSGFAHFFEHMMFQGSKHVGDQQHFKLVTEAGGTLNGSTNRDRTNYFETVPSNQLEKVLWLESDRMGFLLDAVSQRKFEIQRDTVKNERAQNFDNRPYGTMMEKISEAIYPEGHPYSWPTIGYVEDLDKVDVNDLKAFFLRWYGPNNAVLTIGGDIDTEQTLAWVNQYFGSIPSGPEVKTAEKQSVTLPEDRFVTVEDRIQQPMVLIGWPTAYQGSQYQANLDVLAQVLGQGTNSFLYQNLVKTEKAVDAGAFQDCAELACTFYVYAMASSDKKGELASLYDQIMQLLNKFEYQGVDKARLQQIVGMEKANAVFALQSVSGKVSQLASNQTFYGHPDRLKEELDAIEAVTPQSLLDAYHTFISEKHKAVLSVVPYEQAHSAVQRANFVTPSRHLPDYQPVAADTLHYRQVNEHLDRSVVPPVADAVTAKMPTLYRLHLDNNIEVLGTQNTETPTVQIQIRLPVGNRHVSAGKEGLAELTASLLQEGTRVRSAEQIQAALDTLGSTVSIDAQSYVTTINISALSQNVAQTLSVVEELLFQPAFRQQDFARIQHQMIEGAIYQHQTSGWLASQATREVLFHDTLFARASNGTLASIRQLTLDDVKNFYDRYYTANRAQVIVVGDIASDTVSHLLKPLVGWKHSVAPDYASAKVKPLKGQTIYLVDKPESPQSVVRLVRQGLPFDATGEVFKTTLANFNLAGNFNSRINMNLREDKGYTYGSSAYYAATPEVGALIFDAQVRADATAASIKEMIQEMKRYSEQGMSDAELQFMRLAIGQQDALKYETPEQKVRLLSLLFAYHLTPDYLQQRSQIVESVSQSELNQLAKKWFNPKDYQIIVVGDAKRVRPQLEKLNIPLENLEIVGP